MGKNKKKTNRKEEGGLIKYAVVGGALGFGTSLVLLLLLAGLMLGGALAENLADSLILVAVLFGAAVGGLYCAGKQGGGVVVAGLASAGAYVLMLLLATMLCKKAGAENMLTVKAMVAAVAGGCFGGVLKLNKKRKKSKLRR